MLSAVQYNVKDGGAGGRLRRVAAGRVSGLNRRNKRSYRVYKQGLGPLSPLLEPGDVIKRNIRNIKHRARPEPAAGARYHKHGHKGPDIIVDHCPSERNEPSKYYDLRNNNVSPLTSCKSFDSLTWKQLRRHDAHDVRREPKVGSSLQNLLEEERKRYAAHLSDDSVVESSRSDPRVRTSYCVAEARWRPGVGRYRPINADGPRCANPDAGADVLSEPFLAYNFRHTHLQQSGERTINSYRSVLYLIVYISARRLSGSDRTPAFTNREMRVASLNKNSMKRLLLHIRIFDSGIEIELIGTESWTGTEIENGTVVQIKCGTEIKIKSVTGIEIKNLRLSAKWISIEYEEKHSMSTLAKPQTGS
ncbi:hypothetical protein EVAR_5917_1 [Eumeta japonica]|uniref:Uncharacterized protein n=1 Tax=Eumeta variegata TaxID=151549 RepID=A0A4C1TET5_EUMVA|nr:hypothetical protein EVAR_5917_1 [Eumeta japonica]